MARTLPPRRKLEVAFAGYLLDQQKANPLTFLRGMTIVCGSTGRSPDDPEEGNVQPSEPDMPYVAVSCEQARALPDFPTGYGMKEATVMVFTKTHASDDSRAFADGNESSVVNTFENPAPILVALNQPADPATADTRRVQDLYLYAVEDPMSADEHTPEVWEEETSVHVVFQPFDPDYE